MDHQEIEVNVVTETTEKPVPLKRATGIESELIYL